MTSSQGKCIRALAGEALGRGAGACLSAGMALRGPASCQPSPSPVHRLFQQAPKVLLGDKSQPPASFIAVAENINSACGFVHLSSCWCNILLQIGLRSIERMGFYYFLNNKISKPGKMCVLHNVRMKSCGHVLWLQHLLYAFVPLLTSETNTCICRYVRAI